MRLKRIRRRVPTLRRAKPAGRSAVIIEDEPTSREILRRMIAREGWSTREAENGRVAMAMIAEQPPALILLDLMMPIMDGFAFLDELERHPALRDIPVIVITARDLSIAERERIGRFRRTMQKGSISRRVLSQILRDLSPAEAHCA